MKLLIEKDVAQAILTYLATRPYSDVFNFIPALVGLQPAPGEKEEAKPVATESAKAKTKPAKEPASIEAAKAALKKQLDEAGED